MTMKVSEFADKLGNSLKAVVKMAVSSRPTVKPRRGRGDDIVILANGPSLAATIEKRGAELARRDTLCVNFMANTPGMRQLKPDYYVLADPHFFNGIEHENVAQLWRNLASVDWPMTLLVPARRRGRAAELLGDAPCITLATFNFVGIEGFNWLENLAYGHGWAMPRPRNVLIPAIMAAISAGYKRIFIAGADHSWLETIHVDEDNNVISVQPHFYKDSEAETKRSVSEYRGYRLHDILQSFYIAFSSYHRLARFAASRGIEIFNSTPGSFIDAFSRRDF